MNKKLSVILVVVIALVGSLFTYFASNMFFSDIANITMQSITNSYIISTIPAMMFDLYFLLGILFIVRFYLRPKTLKKLSRHYLILTGSFALVGVIFAILTGTVCYGSFTAPYPFAGYAILMLIVHLVFLAASVALIFILNKKLKDDEETFKVTAKYGWYTAAMVLLILLTFYRVGTLMWLPLYVELSTLGKTWVLYLFLLSPAVILVYRMIKVFNLVDNKKFDVIYMAAHLGLMVIILVVEMILAFNDTAVVSSVSPAYPLERLASMPVETICQVVTYLSFSIVYLVQALKRK